MKTITVKLGKGDYKMLEELVILLQKDWIDKMTKSEAIRYAIYSAWCDSLTPFCKECTKEHFLKRVQ